ncbi:MAG: GIY-YIG nuclease family protein [Candidatus Methanofastidiosia archaeon]
MSFAYILVMNLPGNTGITIGKLGSINFKKGTYLYIGSAPSEKRLERHLRTQKKMHWHIDYFLEKAEITEIYITQKKECDVAHAIDLPYITGFGCSDCSCPSHLFYGDLQKSEDLEKYY